MWLKLAVSTIVAATVSSFCYAQGTDEVSKQISWCAQDTGPADCPVTYQTLRANECLESRENRSCLIRLAKEAAAANDCGRAYQLVYACQCNSTQGAARDSIKVAGPSAVCKYLRGG